MAFMTPSVHRVTALRAVDVYQDDTGGGKSFTLKFHQDDGIAKIDVYFTNGELATRYAAAINAVNAKIKEEANA